MSSGNLQFQTVFHFVAFMTASLLTNVSECATVVGTLGSGISAFQAAASQLSFGITASKFDVFQQHDTNSHVVGKGN